MFVEKSVRVFLVLLHLQQLQQQQQLGLARQNYFVPPEFGKVPVATYVYCCTLVHPSCCVPLCCCRVSLRRDYPFLDGRWRVYPLTVYLVLYIHAGTIHT